MYSGAMQRHTPVIAVAAVLAVAFTVLAVLAHLQQHFFFDPAVTLLVQGFRSPVIDTVMRVISWPGYFPEFMLMFGLVLVAFVLLRLYAEALAMIVAEIAVGAMGFGLKPLVDRPRPPASLVWVAEEPKIKSDPWTFTAGHVHTFMVIYGWIALLAVLRLPRGSVLKWVIVFACAAVLLAEGASRIYLGHHWSSDVLGAYLLGGFWLCVELVVYWWIQPRLARRRHKRS
jgi:membrane-associated phospholipid phosphatase